METKKKEEGQGTSPMAEELWRPINGAAVEFDSGGASARMGVCWCVSGVERERVVHELGCYRGREGEGATAGAEGNGH
jgi:hypothetical protein